MILSNQGASAMTVANLVDAYLSDPEKAALRSREEIERRLKKNVIPLIGSVKVAAFGRRDARTVTDAILRRGRKVEATRVFEDVRAMTRWAFQQEYLSSNPLDGVPKPAAPTSSNRVLSSDEIRTLWNVLPTALRRSEQCQRIIKLCLVTAQRVGEVAGIDRRGEIDLTAREWRLPGRRTKNGEAHVVPLSDLAIELIKESAKAAGEKTKWLFPAGEGSLAPAVVARAILRANEISEVRPKGRFQIDTWSAHDLRRTALTGMARDGVPPIVLGHIANHRSVTRAGVTLAVYAQYTYDREKRSALQAWADRLLVIVTEGR
jgi:integrase